MIVTFRLTWCWLVFACLILFAASPAPVAAQTKVQLQLESPDLKSMTAEERKVYLEGYLKRMGSLPDDRSADFATERPGSSMSIWREGNPVRGLLEQRPACVIGAKLEDDDLFLSEEISAFERRQEVLISRSSLSLEHLYGAVVRSRAGAYSLQLRCQGQDMPLLSYASVKRSGKGWTVSFNELYEVTGSTLVPSSDGFLLDMKEELLDFSLRKGARNIRLPTGYRLYPFQHSDIADSRVVMLLSIDAFKKPRFSFMDLPKILRDFGAVRQTTPSSDEALVILFNLDSGRTWTLNVAQTVVENDLSRFCRRAEWEARGTCGELIDRNILFDEKLVRRSDSLYWRFGWERSVGIFDLWSKDPEFDEVFITRGEGGMFLRQTLPVDFKWARFVRTNKTNPVLVFDRQ